MPGGRWEAREQCSLTCDGTMSVVNSLRDQYIITNIHPTAANTNTLTLMMYYIEYNTHTHFFHSLTCFHISSVSEKKIPLVPLVRDGVKRVCAVCVSVMTQSRCMIHVRVRVCLDEFMMDEKLAC